MQRTLVLRGGVTAVDDKRADDGDHGSVRITGTRPPTAVDHMAVEIDGVGLAGGNGDDAVGLGVPVLGEADGNTVCGGILCIGKQRAYAAVAFDLLARAIRGGIGEGANLLRAVCQRSLRQCERKGRCKRRTGKRRYSARPHVVCLCSHRAPFIGSLIAFSYCMPKVRRRM